MSRRTSAWAAAATFAGFAVLSLCVIAWGRDGATGLDASWTDLIAGAHSTPATTVALLLNHFGNSLGSTVVVTILAAARITARRGRDALIIAAACLLTAAATQFVKQLVARPRPEDMAVTSDFGSFPSGHSAQAAALAVGLALVFARHRWAKYAAALYTLAMMVSRTYLSAHWLTDTVAGALLGSAVAFGVWAVGFDSLRSLNQRTARSTGGGVE